MTPSLLATAAALSLGLPIFALGERLRTRKECRLSGQNALPLREEPS